MIKKFNQLSESVIFTKKKTCNYNQEEVEHIVTEILDLGFKVAAYDLESYDVSDNAFDTFHDEDFIENTSYRVAHSIVLCKILNTNNDADLKIIRNLFDETVKFRNKNIKYIENIITDVNILDNVRDINDYSDEIDEDVYDEIETQMDEGEESEFGVSSSLVVIDISLVEERIENKEEENKNHSIIEEFICNLYSIVDDDQDHVFAHIDNKFYYLLSDAINSNITISILENIEYFKVRIIKDIDTIISISRLYGRSSNSFTGLSVIEIEYKLPINLKLIEMSYDINLDNNEIMLGKYYLTSDSDSLTLIDDHYPESDVRVFNNNFGRFYLFELYK